MSYLQVGGEPLNCRGIVHMIIESMVTCAACACEHVLCVPCAARPDASDHAESRPNSGLKSGYQSIGCSVVHPP